MSNTNIAGENRTQAEDHVERLAEPKATSHQPEGDPPYRGPSKHAPDAQEPGPTSRPPQPQVDLPIVPETDPPDPNDPQRSGT